MSKNLATILPFGEVNADDHSDQKGSTAISILSVAHSPSAAIIMRAILRAVKNIGGRKRHVFPDEVWQELAKQFSGITRDNVERCYPQLVKDKKLWRRQWPNNPNKFGYCLPSGSIVE